MWQTCSDVTIAAAPVPSVRVAIVAAMLLGPETTLEYNLVVV